MPKRPIAKARYEHLRVQIEIVLGGSCKQRPQAEMHLDAAAPDAM